jgi:transcription antitermination factor NusG
MGGAMHVFQQPVARTNVEAFNTTPFTLDQEPHWYAVRTRPRHEKTAETELRTKGIEAFVPTLTETHYWSDRKKRVEVPVFPGYAFVNIPLTSMMRLAVLRVNGIVSFIGTQNHGTPIPNEQIECVRKLIVTQTPFHSHPFLKVGQKVVIRGGALDGTTGILSECGRRLVVSVDAISQSIALVVTGHDVRPV